MDQKKKKGRVDAFADMDLGSLDKYSARNHDAMRAERIAETDRRIAEFAAREKTIAWAHEALDFCVREAEFGADIAADSVGMQDLPRIKAEAEAIIAAEGEKTAELARRAKKAAAEAAEAEQARLVALAKETDAMIVTLYTADRNRYWCDQVKEAEATIQKLPVALRATLKNLAKLDEMVREEVDVRAADKIDALILEAKRTTKHNEVWAESVIMIADEFSESNRPYVRETAIFEKLLAEAYKIVRTPFIKKVTDGLAALNRDAAAFVAYTDSAFEKAKNTYAEVEKILANTEYEMELYLPDASARLQKAKAVLAEATRLRAEAETARKKREAEAAERRRKEAEEAERKRKAAEAAEKERRAKEKRDAELRAQKRREAAEAERRRIQEERIKRERRQRIRCDVIRWVAYAVVLGLWAFLYFKSEDPAPILRSILIGLFIAGVGTDIAIFTMRSSNVDLADVVYYLLGLVVLGGGGLVLAFFGAPQAAIAFGALLGFLGMSIVYICHSDGDNQVVGITMTVLSAIAMIVIICLFFFMHDGIYYLRGDDFIMIGNDEIEKYIGDDEHPVVPEGVYRINKNAFKGSDIVTVTLPKTLTTIGASAFRNCKDLVSIEIPEHVVAINERAFERCKSLRRVLLSEGTIVIREQAFYKCKSLRDIYLPDKIRTIENRAFKGCSSMRKLVLPKYLEVLEDEAFADTGIVEVSMYDNVEELQLLCLDTGKDFVLYYHGTVKTWNNIDRTEFLNHWAGGSSKYDMVYHPYQTDCTDCELVKEEQRTDAVRPSQEEQQ